MNLKLTVNGEVMEFEKSFTIAELIEHLELSPTSILIEYNREPLHRDEYARTRIGENDNIEIVQMMAGG